MFIKRQKNYTENSKFYLQITRCKQRYVFLLKVIRRQEELVVIYFAFKMWLVLAYREINSENHVFHEKTRVFFNYYYYWSKISLIKASSWSFQMQFQFTKFKIRETIIKFRNIFNKRNRCFSRKYVSHLFHALCLRTFLN